MNGQFDVPYILYLDFPAGSDNRLRGSLVWHPGWGDGIFPVIGAKNFRVERFGDGGK